MKTNVFLLLAFLLTKLSFSQIEWNPEESAAMIEQVVEVNGMSQQQIYDKAKLWMVTNFKSSESQTLFDDESRTLVGTGNVIMGDLNYTFGGDTKNRRLNFSMIISFKDERYKYVIKNIVYSYAHYDVEGNLEKKEVTSLNHYYQKRARKQARRKKPIPKRVIQEHWDLEFDALAKSLKKEIQSKNSDW